MSNEMDSEKSEALLQWVQLIISGQISSLEELADPQILLQIIHYVDQNKIDNEEVVLKTVVNHLECFYQQSLCDVIKCHVTNMDILNVGKILILILSMSVQAENAFDCVEKITSLGENLQNQIKVMIEAVLKECDNGKIDSNNLTRVLCQSDSLPEANTIKEFYDSPTNMSASPFYYNSPIKTLMASPQMQSRKSQATISKLYNKLNQFQMQINRLKQAQIELKQEAEQLRQQLDEKETKIQLLRKEATKVVPLQEEINSLTQFEGEVDEIAEKYDKLQKSTKELENYKKSFLIMEKDFAKLEKDKKAERRELDDQISNLRQRYAEEIKATQKLLEKSNVDCHDLQKQIVQIKAEKEEISRAMQYQENGHRTEIEMLKKTLAECQESRDKILLKSDNDVLQQIARESELKQCFREQKDALQSSLDEVLLENADVKHKMETVQQKWHQAVNENHNLQTTLTSCERELNQSRKKYDSLQNDFNSFEIQTNEEMDELVRANAHLKEMLKTRKSPEDCEVAGLNSNLQDQSRSFTSELHEAKQIPWEFRKLKETSSSRTSTSIDGNLFNDDSVTEKPEANAFSPDDVKRELKNIDNDTSKMSALLFNVQNKVMKNLLHVTEQESAIEGRELNMDKIQAILRDVFSMSRNEVIAFCKENSCGEFSVDDNFEILLKQKEKLMEELKNERCKNKEYRCKLKDNERTINTVRNDNMNLELKVVCVKNQMKDKDKENRKLREKVKILDKKLLEEEFINKRLAVEARTAEAQLAHTERQLKTQTFEVYDKMECSSQLQKPIRRIAENISSESMTEDSLVANDSILLESSVKERNSLENINIHTSCGSIHQDRVLQKLRRRSAVYSNENFKKPLVQNKVCSTVGTESFVVGQFSNTMAEEPDEHHYEWDRILELKKRNSYCVRHLRSSYPVETQVCPTKEFLEEDLKSGVISADTSQSRKRQRDSINYYASKKTDKNVHSSVSTSQSQLQHKCTTVYSADITKPFRNPLLEKKSENIEPIDHRESIAFKIDITPVKKARKSAMPPRDPSLFEGKKKGRTTKDTSKFPSEKCPSRQ